MAYEALMSKYKDVSSSTKSALRLEAPNDQLASELTAARRGRIQVAPDRQTLKRPDNAPHRIGRPGNYDLAASRPSAHNLQ